MDKIAKLLTGLWSTDVDPLIVSGLQWTSELAGLASTHRLSLLCGFYTSGNAVPV